MDNRKLLKFLFKDISEIEDIVGEKGSEGFDQFEIDFIQSRFKGAKQIIQILSEKENKQAKLIRPRPAAAFEELEEEKTEEEKPEPEVIEETETEQETTQACSEPEESAEELQDDSEEEAVPEEPESEDSQDEPIEEPDEVTEEPVPDVRQKSDTSESDANQRLGDSFSKEKSVNDLLGNNSNKLENKISNSPVSSIKTAIGINDRYLFIRELFEGNADLFSKAVDEIDKLNTIQEAVSYLQQNHKWKKTETSLKFVNLVKRRFPNG